MPGNMGRLNHNTTLALYRLLRCRMAELAQLGCSFHDKVEIDESYFGPACVRGVRGRGARRKTPAFSILKRGGRVHCQIVRNCSKSTVMAIIEGRVATQAVITTDGFASYDGLVEAGFARHHRINKYPDPTRLQRERGPHQRHRELLELRQTPPAKFNGLHSASFPTFLKETEFRFNNRHNDIHKLLLNSCRTHPLRQPQLA